MVRASPVKRVEISKVLWSLSSLQVNLLKQHMSPGFTKSMFTPASTHHLPTCATHGDPWA
eukprot:3955335-Amphidinium_carterae.1